MTCEDELCAEFGHAPCEEVAPFMLELVKCKVCVEEEAIHLIGGVALCQRCTDNQDGKQMSNLDFVKCEGCEAEAVTMDNPDGVYLCQGCYDACEEDSFGEEQEAARAVARAVAQKSKARRDNAITAMAVLVAATLMALAVYTYTGKSPITRLDERTPFMRIERILDQPEDK